MEIKIELNKDEMLKLCEKDKNFQVYIQQAALNYLRNCKLKPLMRDEIVREVEQYKNDLKRHVKEILPQMGITRGSGWNNNSIYLSEELGRDIRAKIIQEMEFIITDIVSKELSKVSKKMDEDIKMWNSHIERKCKDSITSKTIENIAKSVIEEKFKGK
jgi:hypothetical protein